MIKKILMVGLGNPGSLYQNTRHNIGQDFVHWFHEQKNFSPWKRDNKNLAQVSILEETSVQIVLALPLTFMNESGKTLKQLVKNYHFPLENIIIVHDDNDLIIGNFKISFNRGSAGHKGIESIIHSLNSQAFYRLRIGIQPQNGPRQKAESLVLKKFTPQERKIIMNNFPLMQEALGKIKQTIIE